MVCPKETAELCVLHTFPWEGSPACPSFVLKYWVWSRTGLNRALAFHAEQSATGEVAEIKTP